MKNHSNFYLSLLVLILFAQQSCGKIDYPHNKITSNTRGIIYFAYCQTLACRCMVETSELMNEYIHTLVTGNSTRSNLFVVKRINFIDSKYDAFAKKYKIKYAPAIIITDTNDNIIYKKSGQFAIGNVEQFNNALEYVLK